MSNFVNLHGHTCFSFLDGMGRPDQICQRIVNLQQTAVACTDHGNVHAHIPFAKAAKKHNLKVIFGLEAYVVPDIGDRSPVLQTKGAGSFPHITLLARTQQGYHNLMKLHKESWDNVYYKPRIDYSMLWKYQEGLTVLSGCVGGLPLSYIREDRIDDCVKHMSDMKRNIEHYYAEFIPSPDYGIPGYVLSKLAEIAYDLRIAPVMTSDAHFPTPADHITEDIMLCVGTGQRLHDRPRKMQLAGYHYYGDIQDLIERTIAMEFNANPEWFQHAIENTTRIADACENVEIPKAGKFQFIGLELNETAESKLWKLIMQGAMKRMQQGQLPAEQNDVYYQRASYEYNILKTKGFCDYVLAVNDIVQNGKQNNEIVMLRGSAAGCLLFWLMGTSETDSMKHGLSFERFFDMNRNDPPDVDMDFESRKRDSHINFVFNKYGTNNCAQISNVSKIKAKQAVQDTARVLGIPRSEYQPLAAALDSADEEVEKQIDAIEEPSALEVLSLYPQIRLAAGIVGQYRQSSIHAAGIIISPDELSNSVGVANNKNGRQVVSMDKRGASDLGYLKMDMLSVNALDIVAETVRKIGLPVSALYDLPLDDPNVYRTANAGKLAGVFQLSGGSALRVSRKIGLDSFQDLYAASALCRPGPSELVEVYADNKHNPEQFEKYCSMFHPVIQDIVKDTFGVMIYQEQVMRIARELAGFEWVDVHKLRKGIQDKLGLIPGSGPIWESEWKTKFVEGCMRNNIIDEQQVLYVWENIKKYGGYGFNKSHACVYGQISYWMLYLKTYYADVFYETYLQLESTNVTKKSLVREYTESGGNVMLFDLDNPKAHFNCISPKRIVGGFADLKGIGDITVSNALEKGQKGTAFIQALGEGIARQIQDTGALSGQWNTQRLIALAPWFPVPATGFVERQFNDGSFSRIADILEWLGTPSNSDILTMGYLTEVEIDEEKIFFVLEDEGGMLLCRVPMKRVAELKPMFGNMRVGDYVAFSGWFSGEILFLKHGMIALAAPDVKLENRNRVISEKGEKAKSTAEKALDRWKRYKGSAKPKEQELFERAELAFMTACEKIKEGLGEEYFTFWLENIGKPNPYIIPKEVEFDHA